MKSPWWYEMKRILSYIDIRGFSRKKKIHFVINISIGIIIAIFFHFLEQTDWGESTINKAFDFVITREAEKSLAAMKSLDSQKNSKMSDQILFVEIDDETYRKWGKPLITPRDRLADMISLVSQGGAKVIILDVLLEDKDCFHPGGDTILGKVLQGMKDRRDPVKVIFPVRIGQDGGILKDNLFRDIIESNPNFYAATANIAFTATDRLVRYWIPSEKTKGNNGDIVLWNMSFLATILSEDKETELAEVESKIKNGTLLKAHYFSMRRSGRIAISTDRDDIYLNRIRFFLIPKNTITWYPGGNLFSTLYQVEEVKHADFKDKIVIIGNSSPEAGDIYPTPVGDLAGMFIIGNAINTISLGIQPSRTPWVLNILIEIVMIILAAFVFLYFHTFLAQMIGPFIVFPTLGIVSYFYFVYTGVFLNFVFAMAGMGIHETIVKIEAFFEKTGTRAKKHVKGGQDEN
jgi:hypothetical protein